MIVTLYTRDMPSCPSCDSVCAFHRHCVVIKLPCAITEGVRAAPLSLPHICVCLCTRIGDSHTLTRRVHISASVLLCGVWGAIYTGNFHMWGIHFQPGVCLSSTTRGPCSCHRGGHEGDGTMCSHAMGWKDTPWKKLRATRCGARAHAPCAFTWCLWVRAYVWL